MEMYKKISLIRTPEDKGDIEDELCDRFGDIPRVTERLLLVAVSRAMATELGITKISVTESMITIQVSHPDLALWSEVFAKYKGMRFAPGDPRTILYRIAAPEPTALVYDMISMAYAVAGEDKNKTN
jgi:transcription-repair coupling factor (superfamily II helicase)